MTDKLEIDNAIKELERASDEGSADAFYQLGNLYELGELVTRDFDKALKYLEK